MKKTMLMVWNIMGHGSVTYSIIGLGLVIRVILLVSMAPMPPDSDPLSYHGEAIKILSMKDYAPFWPPGLPFFLAIFYSIFGVSEFVGRASMLLFYIVFSVMMWLLTREMSSTKGANLALLVFSIYPAFVFHSVEPLTALPTATYLASAAYLTILITRKSHWAHPILLGVVLALLVLTRASSALLAVVIPLYIVVKTRKFGSAIIPFIVALVICFGWMMRVNQMTGRWVFINEANSYNFFVGNNPYTPLYKTWWFGSHSKGEPGVPDAYSEMNSEIQSQPRGAQDKLYLRAALDHIVSRPDLFLLRTVNRIRNYFAFDTYTGAMLIETHSAGKFVGLATILLDAFFYLAIMAFAIRYLFDLRLAPDQRGNVVLLLLLAVCYALPYWVSFSHPTYHFPIVPLFGVLAVLFVDKSIPLLMEENRLSWLPSGTRRYGFLIVGAIFLFAQFEWVFVMWTRAGVS